MSDLPIRSLWLESAATPSFPRLTTDLQTDVVVVGAGITGLTAATLLKASGKRVIVLEMARVAAGESGHTTAHLTEHVDAEYLTVEKKFGRAAARDVAASSRAAIAQIERLIAEHQIDCDFARVPGYLFAEREEDLRFLQDELAALQRAGVKASIELECPLPCPVRGAVRIDDQAQLDPYRYLVPLARALAQGSSHVFENTRVLRVTEGQTCRVITDSGTVAADHVVLATNVPFNRVALHTKLAAYRTYAVAYPAPPDFPAGLFDDTAEPYHYIRTQQTPRGRFLIVGGEDHKTGHESDTATRFAHLEEFTRSRFGLSGAAHFRWSGQIIEPVDGLPFIGRNSLSKHVYVATGFSGTGMTFGTLAGMLLHDAILERDNPYRALYEATRVKPLAQAKHYVTENVDFPTHIVSDRLARGGVHSVSDIPPKQGRLLRDAGRMLAVYRDEAGTLHACSAVCPHLGCHVRWNDAERSWDCPCHGSRFTATGELLNGPATADLERKSLG